VITKAEELSKQDSRSDPAVLEGLTLEEAQQLYNKRMEDQSMSKDKGPSRVFILADAEVLANTDFDVIKCVAADYDAAACVPKSSRFGSQRFFWMVKDPSWHVLALRFELDIYFFGDIGNRTAGGHG
jgi:hypothetical protein